MIMENRFECAPEHALRAWGKLSEKERETVLRAVALKRNIIVTVYYIGGFNLLAGLEVSKC